MSKQAQVTPDQFTNSLSFFVEFMYLARVSYFFSFQSIS